MSIASGFTKMKNYILTSSGYKLLSRWTSSQTVHMGDGTDDTDTVEYRFGAMKGVTSSLATDNDEFALSASAGKNLQDQCTQLNQSLTTKLSLSSFKVVTLGGNTNLNDLSECGIYSVKGGLNSPSGDWVIMMVLPINGDANYVHQICFILGRARPFARAYAYGSWTDWVEL